MQKKQFLGIGLLLFTVGITLIFAANELTIRADILTINDIANGPVEGLATQAAANNMSVLGYVMAGSGLATVIAFMVALM